MLLLIVEVKVPPSYGWVISGTPADCQADNVVDFKNEIAAGSLDTDRIVGSPSRAASNVECTVENVLRTTLLGSMPGGM